MCLCYSSLRVVACTLEFLNLQNLGRTKSADSFSPSLLLPPPPSNAQPMHERQVCRPPPQQHQPSHTGTHSSKIRTRGAHKHARTWQQAYCSQQCGGQASAAVERGPTAAATGRAASRQQLQQPTAARAKHSQHAAPQHVGRGPGAVAGEGGCTRTRALCLTTLECKTTHVLT